jgi:DUF971 family protein
MNTPTGLTPDNVQIVGEFLAIHWLDGTEDFISMERLRAASPSAEQQGERDLTGIRYGGSDQTRFPGVVVTGWQVIGGYALLFAFSDGHRTGIYPYPLLKQIAASTAGD